MKIFAVAALSLMTFAPSMAQPTMAQSSASPDTTQIARWNAVVEANPRVFSWQAHNELRHLYAMSGQEVRSMQQADTLLAHSPMDFYVLSILADWKMGNDSEAAVDSLTRRANLYGNLPFLRVASLLQAAEIRRTQSRYDDAQALIEDARSSARKARKGLPKAERIRLKTYQKLADLQSQSLRLYRRS